MNRLRADLRRFKSARPPALLLGGINLVRALGLAGIPVVVASPEDRTPAMASRYCAGRLILPPLAQREAVVEALLHAGECLAGAAAARVPLFYGNDDYLAIVQDYRAALSRWFAFVLNDAALDAALIDKSLFQALAERRGLPVPRRLDWASLDAWEGPVLVKPKSKIGWDDSDVYRRLFASAGKARIFENGRAALAHPLAAALADRLAFQEYLPGTDRSLWSFHGFAARDGELLEWFVGRKIRTYPALTGDSSYLELARDPAISALGREVAMRLPLKGVFKIDLKRSTVTGKLYVLEVNTRHNLWHYMGARNGVNLARVAYDYLACGTRPVHAEATTAYRWLCLHRDYKAYRHLSAHGELGCGRWLWSLLEARKVYDLFSWSDPAPFVFHWLGNFRKIPRFAARKLLRWQSSAS